MSDGRHQVEQLQALIDSSPLALVEFGLDTRIRLWNPAAERIVGWSREEMIGRAGLPMAPASKRAESRELFARVQLGRVGERLRDRATTEGRNAGRRIDRGGPGQRRVRPGRRQHGRVHRHPGTQSARGGRSMRLQHRSSPRTARQSSAVSTADRYCRRRRAAPSRAESPRRRAAASGDALPVAARSGGVAGLRSGSSARCAREGL